ncbi:DUF1330 domain-containing protein [Peterkaempfera griseoplana]|uniref:DUF1330 domain-containing protein n=1 Tax=Peterkaempfera griseoplana TaxID=66896 RepID=UPI0006E31491|nr:DUF1330 domain-containing protein [Peterkaempfera griseoplana]
MPAYAIAHLRDPKPGHPEVLEYMERIDATLAPHSGRFLVHGGATDVLEGSWPGATVVIEFPDLAAARAWYDSPAYRAILRLRTDHIPGDTILVDGVGPGHTAAGKAAGIRAAAE